MKVRCVDNIYHESQLTVGKVYKVVQINKLEDAYFLKADDSRMWWMSIKRFEIVQE